MEEIRLNTIDEAIADFREGNFVIVVDDEDRENEGDFIIAAEKITPEKVNFMMTHGRGVLCAPITEERCAELELDMQVTANTSIYETPFTVTVDLLEGCTTGVSMHDRAATIRALADPKTKPADLGRPGHVNPLRARSRGVLRRAGHTEASVDLAKLAGLYPAAALIEIINEDGTMARLPQLVEVAKRFGLKIISIKDLIAYRVQLESIVEKGVEVDMPTQYGHFRLIPFRQKSNGMEHIALIKGSWDKDEPILVRVHSSCMTGDIFGSCRCECGEQLHKAMEMIEAAGKGVIVYMNQEGRGVFDAVKEKDAVAIEIAEQFGEYLGKGLATVANTVNPEVFVIGGGVSKAGEVLIPFIEPIFQKYAFPPCRGVKFALAKLGNDAGIYGAAALILRERED